MFPSVPPLDPVSLSFVVGGDPHKSEIREVVAVDVNQPHIHVTPDTVCDFKDLPFDDGSFNLVVFDPPHLVNKAETAWMVKKYGTLPADWRDELKKGFDESWRVLKPGGTLIFKWNNVEIPTSEIIKLFERPPLFGHKSGKRMNTNWLVYYKEEEGGECGVD